MLEDKTGAPSTLKEQAPFVLFGCQDAPVRGSREKSVCDRFPATLAATTHPLQDTFIPRKQPDLTKPNIDLAKLSS
jgi:hypothetical protein